jgi:hypothetical protein
MDEIYQTLKIHPERLTLITSPNININSVYIITPITPCKITNHLNEITEYTTKIILDKIINIDGSYEIIEYNDIITYSQKMYYNEIQTKMDNPPLTNGIIVTDPFEFINETLCDKLIDYINNEPNTQIEHWKEANNVNCKFIKIENNKVFDNELFNVINNFIQFIFHKYGILSKGDSGYCLRKIYGPTRLHSDGILDYNTDDSNVSIKRLRNLSVIIALNDDYENGEFYFPSQDKLIKLKKGQIIAFPPYWTHPHTVFAPTNGTYRYTINTWLYQ